MWLFGPRLAQGVLVSTLPMAEAHAVDGLPVVPGEGSNGTSQPRGRKRSCPSAAGSEALSALPHDGSRPRGVTFVHRGSHADGEGAAPPALQQALANMCASLSCPLHIEAGLRVLERQRTRKDRPLRKNRPLTLAAFLCAVLACKGHRHIPQAHSLAAHLVGMSAKTVANTLQNMRKRGNLPIRPRGAGGRPRKEDRPIGREEPSEDEEPPDCEDLLFDVAPSGTEQVTPLAPQPIGEAAPDSDQIGLKLGALVAWLRRAHMALLFVTLFS